jgi:hypothetical protein
MPPLRARNDWYTFRQRLPQSHNGDYLIRSKRIGQRINQVFWERIVIPLQPLIVHGDAFAS